MSRKTLSTLAAIFMTIVLFWAAMDMTLFQPDQKVSLVQAKPIAWPQIIYHDTLTQTTAYLQGSFDGIQSRYVSYRFGWNDTVTSTITMTLWLAEPLGLRCCTQTVTASLPASLTIYTADSFTLTGPFWAQLGGTIENVTGTVTPTLDVVLHGQ